MYLRVNVITAGILIIYYISLLFNQPRLVSPPGALLNYAENLLRFEDDRVALYGVVEGRTDIASYTYKVWQCKKKDLMPESDLIKYYKYHYFLMLSPGNAPTSGKIRRCNEEDGSSNGRQSCRFTHGPYYGLITP